MDLKWEWLNLAQTYQAIHGRYVIQVVANGYWQIHSIEGGRVFARGGEKTCEDSKKSSEAALKKILEGSK